MADLETLVNELPQLVYSLKLTISNSDEILQQLVQINNVQEQLQQIQELIVHELTVTPQKKITLNIFTCLDVENSSLLSDALLNLNFDNKTQFINKKIGNLQKSITLNDLNIKIDSWIEWSYLLQAIATDILDDSQLITQLNHINFFNLFTKVKTIDRKLNINLSLNYNQNLQHQIQEINLIQEDLLELQENINYIINNIKNSKKFIEIILEVSSCFGKSNFTLEWLDDNQELIISSNNEFFKFRDILNYCNSLKEKISNLILHSNALKEKTTENLITFDRKSIHKKNKKHFLEKSKLRLITKILCEKKVPSTLVIISSLLVSILIIRIINEYDSNFKRNLTFNQEESAVANFKSAQKLGMEAVALAHNPPYPLIIWEQAETKWQQAINLLERIPEGTSVFMITQNKLKFYRINYISIKQRIVVENQAIINFNLSQNLAKEASFLVQHSPNSLLAKSKLEQAINLLKDIPAGTSVSIQAQEILTIYKTNYAAIARD